MESIPSRVSLEGLEDRQRIRQVVQMLSPDRQTVVSERVLDYRTLGRSVLVFPSGAFSQGSMQYGPFSEFGAELGLISGDRRCRLVQLFDEDANFSKLTLIPEYRQGTDTEDIHRLNARPFRVEDWLGEWKGAATTLYADWSPATEGHTNTLIRWEGDRLIEVSHRQGHSTQRQWRVCPASDSPSSNSAMTTLLNTEHTAHPLRALLLPGGAVSVTPSIIPRRQTFDLEAVWHVSAHQRQRMIRHYSESGAWTALTLIDEKKLG